MKPFQMFLTVVVFLQGCVSITKYQRVVLANASQRETIRKLHLNIKTLQQQNHGLLDSLAIFKNYAASRYPSKTHTAANIRPESGVEVSNDSFQTAREKKILYYMNYARVKPKEFLKTGVLPNLKDTTGYYERTLIETLRKMKAVSPLMASKKMYALALCHARESGLTGYVGHIRSHGCAKGYNAECCAYGHANYSSDEALNYVLQLLVDDGVPSLGHREIILLPWLKTAAVSLQPHVSYGENVVIDFSATN